MSRRVTVLGMGYVGCVTAACLARDGHQVTGVDIDDDKVAAINAGQSPVQEPGLNELLKIQVDAGRLVATTDLELAIQSSEMALIAVGTPSARDGSVETGAAEHVVAGIGQALRDTADTFTVVVRSTVLPGVLEDKLATVLEDSLGESLGDRVHLCNNPEFLREASAIRDYDQPPFIVVGASEQAAAEEVLSLYDSIEAEHVVTDTRTASLVKYSCNAFHAVKVGFANEIGAVAKGLGADGAKVMQIVCRDKQLNISKAYLRPGFAFGGSCLPKDLRAINRFAQQNDIKVNLLESILHSNQSHLTRGWELICETGCRRIGLVGLSFKAGTDDLRESPLVTLAETLLGKGYDLKIYDPGVSVSGLVGANLTYAERHLPHLAKLLVDNLDELFDHAELAVFGSDIANGIELPSEFSGQVVDLREDLIKAASPTPEPSSVT